jgi:hypothetical protein
VQLFGVAGSGNAEHVQQLVLHHNIDIETLRRACTNSFSFALLTAKGTRPDVAQMSTDAHFF